jgi:hypothetical protein
VRSSQRWRLRLDVAKLPRVIALERSLRSSPEQVSLGKLV